MLNRVELIGRLGGDPEVKQLQNGGEVANFSVATSEKWTDKASGEKRERTEWHRIVAWGNLAALAGKYLHKGSLVYLEGQLQTRKWEDQSGTTRYTTEVVLAGFNGKIKFLETRKDGEQQQQREPEPPPQQQSMAEVMDDEIPF